MDRGLGMVTNVSALEQSDEAFCVAATTLHPLRLDRLP
jgi:hypothetical protein